MRLQNLMRQINLLNGILLAVILAFGYFVLVPIFIVEVKIPTPTPPKTAEQKTGEVSAQAENPQPQEYAVIAEKNLFHPERIIPPEKKAEGSVPRPEFVLYGTLISDGVRIAYLSDKKAPRTTPGRGKRQTGLKIGEAMSGYTLKEVLPDHIVMARGDDRIEVRVIEPGTKKERGAEGVAGPGGVPQGMTPSPAGHAAPAARIAPGPAFPGVPAPAVGTTQPPAASQPSPARSRRVSPNVMQQLRQSLAPQSP